MSKLTPSNQPALMRKTRLVLCVSSAHTWAFSAWTRSNALTVKSVGICSSKHESTVFQYVKTTSFRLALCSDSQRATVRANVAPPYSLLYYCITHINCRCKHIPYRDFTIMASSSIKYTLTLDPSKDEAPTRDHASHPESLPEAKHTHTHPTLTAAEGSHNASLFFIGTATTVLEFGGVRLLSDPNFIHV